VTLDAAGRSLSHSELVTGWLRNEGAPIKQQVRWGRPVDVAELPDGSVLVSDDTGDAVYRITYQA
jgi:glucose/arabinose dehydrogenase